MQANIILLIVYGRKILLGDIICESHNSHMHVYYVSKFNRKTIKVIQLNECNCYNKSIHTLVPYTKNAFCIINNEYKSNKLLIDILNKKLKTSEPTPSKIMQFILLYFDNEKAGDDTDKYIKCKFKKYQFEYTSTKSIKAAYDKLLNELDSPKDYYIYCKNRF